MGLYYERGIHDILDESNDPDLVEPDIYNDPDADYDENFDGDPSNSLQKELDPNYKREA